MSWYWILMLFVSNFHHNSMIIFHYQHCWFNKLSNKICSSWHFSFIKFSSFFFIFNDDITIWRKQDYQFIFYPHSNNLHIKPSSMHYVFNVFRMIMHRMPIALWHRTELSSIYIWLMIFFFFSNGYSSQIAAALNNLIQILISAMLHLLDNWQYPLIPISVTDEIILSGIGACIYFIATSIKC